MKFQKVDAERVAEFRELVDRPEANENAIQAFMETHSAFLPTPNLLHHHLHLNCVIAKFPVGERSTDYAYLTKSTIQWKLVLVELEDSSKRIFKKSGKNVAFTAEFTEAVAQIHVWRDYVGNNLPQLREKLRPLLVPPQMANNKLSVEYVLVIGRSEELEHNEARRLRLANFGEQMDLTVLTYDTIVRSLESGPEHKKSILRANSRGFHFQSAEGMPIHLFAYVKPEHLELSPEAETALREDKFDIDAWKRNEPLVINDKYSENSDPALLDGLDPFVRGLLARRRQSKERAVTADGESPPED